MGNQEFKNKKSCFGCSTIIIVFIIFLLIGRCGDKNKNPETDTLSVTTNSSNIISPETETQASTVEKDTPDKELQNKKIGESVTIKGVTVTVNSVTDSKEDYAYEVNVTYKNNSGKSLSITPYDWETVNNNGSEDVHVGGDCSFDSEDISDGKEWTGIVTLWKDNNTEKIKFESSDLNFLYDNEKYATWLIEKDIEKEITTTTTKASELSEIEILMLQNHPKLFGSNEMVNTIWADYMSEDFIMVKNAIGHHRKYNDAILVLDCYKSNGYKYVDSNIHSIYVRFDNFKKDKDVNFETGLAIAKEYFPNDIISEHYHYFESFYQILENGKTSYSVVYKLNDGDDPKEYSHWLSVVLCTNEMEKMDNLIIYCERNGDSRFEPEKIEWNYDFLSAETIKLTELS